MKASGAYLVQGCACFGIKGQTCFCRQNCLLWCYVVLRCADLRCAYVCCAVVFGRVLEGMDVVDKLQNLAVDRSGRPGQKVVSDTKDCLGRVLTTCTQV